MERLLDGVDGSQAGLDALEWSADLARRAGLELVAARVFVSPQAELPPDQDARLHDEQLNELDEWCASLPGGPTPTRTLLLDGDPPDALLAAAHAEHADLLVVGGRGAGGFMHLHLGSVAHHLTHHTTVPLAIVPRTGATAIEHVVVGIDGSAGSLAATRFCAELAASLEVAVTAVYSFEPFTEWNPEGDSQTWATQAHAKLHEWATPIVNAGVTVAVEVETRTDVHPVVTIERALAAHPGAVAVVGTRGLGGFSGLRLGRVPLQLVHHTGAAVILVPAPPSR